MKILRYLATLMRNTKFLLRSRYWSVMLGRCGSNVRIWNGVLIYSPEKVQVGHNTGIGDYVVIWGGGGVEIGDDVLIAAHAVITSQTHDSFASLYRETSVGKKVVIKRNVWIGAGSIIMPGVEIGENSIIGAGSVVTKSLPACSVAYGSPARVTWRTKQHIVVNRKCH